MTSNYLPQSIEFKQTANRSAIKCNVDVYRDMYQKLVWPTSETEKEKSIRPKTKSKVSFI